MKRMRQASTLLIGMLVSMLVIGALVAFLFLPGTTMYVYLFAMGMAVALQKHVGSFAAYFMIRFGRFFSEGNRVRIGNVKGDVRHIGLFHFILDEVGEDEKLGGELTGRLIHMPNLVVLDLPVLNYSQDYTVSDAFVPCDYIFDEIRLPLKVDSNLRKAKGLLHEIIERRDREHIDGAKAAFGENCPNFLHEAEHAARVLSHVEPGRIWLKGKYVCPMHLRNELRTIILDEFVELAAKETDIRLA